MENKYFTPKIEDIRVGYFCEIKVHDQWLPETITKLLYAEYYGEQIDAGKLRVPYLTKQDLRQEGWAVGFPPAVHGQTVQSSPYYKFYIEKGNYMGLILNDGRLEILLKDVLLDSRTENS